jgi:hypothetical protein
METMMITLMARKGSQIMVASAAQQQQLKWLM